MNYIARQQQSGGVSIFIVIFSALLVTIVTVSFVSIMLRNQQQASNADLSNSAYDSALAGVEDAKRLLLVYRKCLQTGSTAPECIRADTAINVNNDNCNSVKEGLYAQGSTDPEVLIQRQQSDTNSEELDQAYTCVTIQYASDDLKGTLSDGESRLIPLESAPGSSFNKVKISWFLKPQESPATVLNLPGATTFPRHTTAAWPAATPPVMRTQLIQMSDTFSVTQFDGDGSNYQSNTNTLFLYPQLAGGDKVLYSPSFTSDNRTEDNIPKSPVPVKCHPADYAGGKYACYVTIDLPNPIGGNRKNFYVQLGALYNKTDFKIELLDEALLVKVVAPVVDSTGRANDLFRRVRAQIDFDGRNYPTTGIEIEGNLCKDFTVSTAPDGFRPNSCTP